MPSTAGTMLEGDYAARLDNEGLRLLSTIRENSRRMGRLIEDLLAFSRSAHAPLATAEVDTDALVRKVVRELVPDSPGGSSIFDVQPLPMVYGDHGLMRQVWVNLLSNAMKYSAKQPSPRVEVRGQRQGADVVFSVRDDGVGFDMKYENKLFGVFQRLHGAKSFDGTGVGLAIVHRIVTRHRGRIWANGIVGQGAILSFALPSRDPMPSAPGSTSLAMRTL